MSAKHAFMIAGTHSGCGKTTIALGLMASLRARGFRVQPFKVGPDFIDPGFHTLVCECESRNLDGWMLGRAYNHGLFRRLLARADVAVVEGVMGLYDGYDGTTESGSSAEMAKWLDIPVVLVVDARSMARSAAALVHGFRDFDRGLELAGVIFNRIGGPGHLEYLKEAMAAALPDIPVLGGIPKEELIGLPERHLGLVTADETRLDRQWTERLIGLVEGYVDIDSLLKGASRTPELSEAEGEDGSRTGPMPPPESVTIAVARDAAFCFYYPDNFELLRESGAGLHFFSPIAGETFPEEASGLYLGGGYPELFAERISGMGVFLDSVRKAAGFGMPVYAECGGLMTLSRFIETTEGAKIPMAGVLPFGTRMLRKRKALGYTEVVLREPCLLGASGTVLRGHEFHYSEISDEREEPSMKHAYRLKARKFETVRPEGYMMGSVLASYIHLHWGSAPGAAANFVRSCLEWRRSRPGVALNNGPYR